MPPGHGRDAPRPARAPRPAGLARRLTAARLRAGLTQAELAEQLGCSVGAVRKWESGAGSPTGLYAKAVTAFLRGRR
jgi:transcriptional regulator with XRE-family HTH domain